jgi:hypothetical protein
MKKAVLILYVVFCLFDLLYAQRTDYALEFDGQDDYAHTPIQCFPNITSNFTIELWAKPSGIRALTPESDTGVSGTIEQRYAIFPEWGTAYGENHSGAGISVGTNGIGIFDHAAGYLPSLLVYNTYIYNWIHIAVVFKNNQPFLYLNGSLVKTGLQSSKIVHSSAYLGEVNAGYGFYQGLLDEVRIWSCSRSEQDIKSDMNKSLNGNEPGLAGYWRLNEGSGSTSIDMSKNANHLTLINNPTWIVSDRSINRASTSQQKKSMNVAVIEFSQKGNLEIKDAGIIVAEWMSSSLQKTNSFNLYERILLQNILDEQKLGMTGIFDEKTTVQIGKMYGVNAIVTGTISKFGETISIVVKLIDTETAKILASSDFMTKTLDDVPQQMNQLAQNIVNSIL